MKCDLEMLQMYLDKELDTRETAEVKEHLASCKACRQELSRLKLLWIDLGETDEIETSLALPYLRQQVISNTRVARQTGENASWWDTQKMAWRPLGYAASYLPGAGTMEESAKSLGRNLPGAAANSLGALVKLGRRGYAWAKERSKK
ncbi:MAG: anti-sigma factor family protein [Candidatus Saccharibacteria bacterium]